MAFRNTVPEELWEPVASQADRYPKVREFLSRTEAGIKKAKQVGEDERKKREQVLEDATTEEVTLDVPEDAQAEDERAEGEATAVREVPEGEPEREAAEERAVEELLPALVQDVGEDAVPADIAVEARAAEEPVIEDAGVVEAAPAVAEGTEPRAMSAEAAAQLADKLGLTRAVEEAVELIKASADPLEPVRLHGGLVQLAQTAAERQRLTAEAVEALKRLIEEHGAALWPHLAELLTSGDYSMPFKDALAAAIPVEGLLSLDGALRAPQRATGPIRGALERHLLAATGLADMRTLNRLLGQTRPDQTGARAIIRRRMDAILAEQDDATVLVDFYREVERTDGWDSRVADLVINRALESSDEALARSELDVHTVRELSHLARQPDGRPGTETAWDAWYTALQARVTQLQLPKVRELLDVEPSPRIKGMLAERIEELFLALDDRQVLEHYAANPHMPDAIRAAARRRLEALDAAQQAVEEARRQDHEERLEASRHHAREALDAGRFADARATVMEGFALQPGDDALTALSKEIEAREASAKEAVAEREATAFVERLRSDPVGTLQQADELAPAQRASLLKELDTRKGFVLEVAGHSAVGLLQQAPELWPTLRGLVQQLRVTARQKEAIVARWIQDLDVQTLARAPDGPESLLAYLKPSSTDVALYQKLHTLLLTTDTYAKDLEHFRRLFGIQHEDLRLRLLHDVGAAHPDLLWQALTSGDERLTGELTKGYLALYKRLADGGTRQRNGRPFLDGEPPDHRKISDVIWRDLLQLRAFAHFDPQRLSKLEPEVEAAVTFFERMVGGSPEAERWVAVIFAHALVNYTSTDRGSGARVLFLSDLVSLAPGKDKAIAALVQDAKRWRILFLRWSPLLVEASERTSEELTAQLDHSVWLIRLAAQDQLAHHYAVDLDEGRASADRVAEDLQGLMRRRPYLTGHALEIWAELAAHPTAWGQPVRGQLAQWVAGRLEDPSAEDVEKAVVQLAILRSFMKSDEATKKAWQTLAMETPPLRDLV
ncbi:MAG TPA: hypothetical protein VJB16_06620, partial [archaeon]|nr:hypothetical protein [archaeon]